MLHLLFIVTDHQFLLFHLGDSFTFFNELVKTQATCKEENDIFGDYLCDLKGSQRKYGRAAVFAVLTPYFIACGKYRGMAWKAFSFYVLCKMMDAIYDSGIYLRFFLQAPKSMRDIVALEPENSFASIQTRLFMKHCAKVEIQKAKGEEPKKLFTELIVVKSYRNQIFDRIQAWKNFGVFLSNAFNKPKNKRE